MSKIVLVCNSIPRSETIMDKPRKIYISFVILIALLFNIVPPVFGTSLDNFYQQQQQTEQRIRETENILRQKELERQRTINELNALNRDMVRTNNEIETLEKRIENLEKTISSTEKDIAVKEEEVTERTNIFEARFKQSYQVGHVGYLEILFQSTSVSDFLTRFEFLKRLNQNDALLLAELEAERDELEKKKQDLYQKQQDVINTKIARQQNCRLPVTEVRL